MGKRILIDAYDIRLHMASLGWLSTDAIGDNSQYTVSFYRYDWHGFPVSQVSFYACTRDLGRIADAVARAARLALRAWKEYPHEVPFQPDPQREALEVRRSLPPAAARSERNRTISAPSQGRGSRAAGTQPQPPRQPSP